MPGLEDQTPLSKRTEVGILFLFIMVGAPVPIEGQEKKFLVKNKFFFFWMVIFSRATTAGPRAPQVGCQGLLLCPQQAAGAGSFAGSLPPLERDTTGMVSPGPPCPAWEELGASVEWKLHLLGKFLPTFASLVEPETAGEPTDPGI